MRARKDADISLQVVATAEALPGPHQNLLPTELPLSRHNENHDDTRRYAAISPNRLVPSDGCGDGEGVPGIPGGADFSRSSHAGLPTPRREPLAAKNIHAPEDQ